MGELWEQAGKFSIVGAMAFALDYLLLMLMTFHLGIRPVYASAISFVVVNLFTYFTSMRYVFTHRSDVSRGREFLMFVGLLLVGMLINSTIVEVIVQLAGTTRLSVSVAKGLASFVDAVWNFFSRRRWLDGSTRE